MSALKLWHSKLFHIAGQELRLKVKSLSFLEAPEFLGHMEELRKNLKATGDGGQNHPGHLRHGRSLVRLIVLSEVGPAGRPGDRDR